jgi:hypothetical protein
LIAQIPKRGSLYRNYSPHPESTGYAGRVKEVLAIDELHRRLGHVGHEYERQLVQKGLVIGIELDKESKPSFCGAKDTGNPSKKSGRNPEPKLLATRFIQMYGERRR